MRVITVRQPWAGAIFDLGKTVENRSDRRGQETARKIYSHHGTLGIHTSARLDGLDAFRDIERISGHRVPDLGLPGQSPAWALGALVGVINVVGVHTADACYDPANDRYCSPWAQPGTAHIVRHPQVRLLHRPIEMKGQLGPWTITDPAMLAEIRRQPS